MKAKWADFTIKYERIIDISKPADINAAQSHLAVNFELQLRWLHSTAIDQHVRELQRYVQLTSMINSRRIFRLHFNISSQAVALKHITFIQLLTDQS